MIPNDDDIYIERAHFLRKLYKPSDGSIGCDVPLLDMMKKIGIVNLRRPLNGPSKKLVYIHFEDPNPLGNFMKNLVENILGGWHDDYFDALFPIIFIDVCVIPIYYLKLIEMFNQQ